MSYVEIHPEDHPLVLIFIGQGGKSVHYFRDRKPEQPHADRSSMTILERAALRTLLNEARIELDRAEGE